MMSVCLRALLISAVGLSAACATTPPSAVTLAMPPSSEAPLAERRAYYEQHRPVLVQTAPLSNRRPWSARATMTLQSGGVVASPAALLPAIPATSVSGRAALKAARAESVADAWGVGAVTASGVALAGFAGFLAITMVIYAAEGTSDTTDLRTAGVVVGGASMVTAAVGAALTAVATGLAEDAAVERETAFFTYDRALQQRLALDPLTLSVDPPATPGAP